MTTIQNVCVFCASTLGASESFRQAAYDLGEELVNAGVGLVYGGSTNGLMGVVSDSVMEHGGYVLGISPSILGIRENEHKNISELIHVETMHERKAMMAQRSDAFVALPGGYGTLEELFEVITWAQIGIHIKPIIIVNIDGYYDPLLKMIEQGVQQGFIRPADPDIIQSTNDVRAIIPMLRERPTLQIKPKLLGLDKI